MNVLDFPKYADEEQVPNEDGDDFGLEEDAHVPELGGELHFAVRVGQDVVLYTEDTVSRPWIGRVTEIFPDSRQFEVHWMEKGTSCTYGIINYGLSL